MSERHFTLRYKDPRAPHGVASVQCVDWHCLIGSDDRLLIATTVDDQTIYVPTESLVSMLTYDPEPVTHQEHTPDTLASAPVGTVAWDDDDTPWLKTHDDPYEWYAPAHGFITPEDDGERTLYTHPRKDNQ